MLSLRRQSGGFTLIELLIGMGLLAILATMAVPAYQHWTQNTQIRNAAEGMLNGMQLARAEAVRRNVTVQFVLTSSTRSGWTVAPTASPTATIQARDAGEGSSNAAITVSPAGADRITYNGMGWLSANADGSNSIAAIDVTSATMTGTEIRPLRVVVTGGGSLKMCDPAVASGDPRACP